MGIETVKKKEGKSSEPTRRAKKVSFYGKFTQAVEKLMENQLEIIQKKLRLM